MTNIEKKTENDLMQMTTEIAASYLTANTVEPTKIKDIIRDVYETLTELDQETESLKGNLKPAVPVSESVTPDYIICLEDGKKLKMLKRHLRTAYGMTPEQYREKWGLPADYPMVSPNYAKRRSHFAKQIGLGQNDSIASPTRRGRRPKNQAAA